MINFLPPEAKSAVKREYIVRTMSVWALLLAVVTAVWALLLAPTYILLMQELGALGLEVVRMEDARGAQAYAAARAELEKAQLLARELNAAPGGHTASTVLEHIQEAQTSSITLSGFSYEYTGAVAKSVTVRGVAATRETLIQFSAALERDPLFARADVPVSDLAEGRNLPFTLTIAFSPGSP